MTQKALKRQSIGRLSRQNGPGDREDQQNEDGDLRLPRLGIKFVVDMEIRARFLAFLCNLKGLSG